MSNTTKPNDVSNVCNICDKSFSSWHNLEVHKEAIHEKMVTDCKSIIHDGKRLTCDICQKQYKKRVQLQHHIATIHNNIKKEILACNLGCHTGHRVKAIFPVWAKN